MVQWRFTAITKKTKQKQKQKQISNLNMVKQVSNLHIKNKEKGVI